ncbi:MAG: PQQ-dependent sugar dehydrogenase [Acidobacteriota bacterium]|nr:PQQ-dependent sugar dehydrogenase [Acidobacteriota bacterium]
MLSILLYPSLAPAGDLPLEKIKLPEGFKIDIYAENVTNARAMAVSPSGVVFVGSRRAEKLHAVVDTDKDNKADKVYLIDDKLAWPSGVTFRDGSLYVGAVNSILRYDDIENRLDNPPEPVVVIDSLPKDRWHGWKHIDFGPDGLLYIPVGAPCNICDRKEPYATISRMKADGTGLETFARGVRNSVGFDWHPVTKELWFTDNGADEMGDDIPPDELNYAPKKGMHFGFPFIHGGGEIDPKYGKGHTKDQYVMPAQPLGPHVAALGMRFYTGTMFPEEYRNQIFIPEHGSWNRSKKIGYRVTLVRLKGNKALGYEVFAEGWLQGETPWGRPVAIIVMPDGAMLLSDDAADVIYRIYYEG